MKKNIKEDIKNIEEIIELSKEEIDAKDENITAILDVEDLISLEHILSAYKRVLQENEKLKTQLLDTLEGQKVIKEETPQYIKENYIQKDKIEEILSETEITDFNSLVEAFLEIKKLLESE